MNKIFLNNNLNFYLLLLIFAIFVFRVIALILSPLEISADEAQYWLWSQNPQLGYFSKPPIIAWIISLSTFLFGDTIFAIRLFAPIIHFITGFVLLYLFREIFQEYHYNSLFVPIIWLTLPITGVGSFLISTDTPLMLIWSISLLFIYYSIISNYYLFWFLAGLFSGLALLSKYAGFFLLLGIVLYVFFIKTKKRRINNLIIYFIGFLITSSPTVFWNINNSFSTIRHLSDNAVIDSPNYSISGSIDFLTSQFFVLGPFMFMVFISSVLTKNKKSRVLWLLWFILPVFIIMTIQGFFSEANANWAATALPGAVILCTFFLHGKYNLSILAISTNVIISFILIILSIAGTFGEYGPKSDPLRKLRGWKELSEVIKNTSRTKNIDYFVVNRRGIAAPLMYYLRDSNINIRLISSNDIPKNHYELNYSFNSKETNSIIYITEDKVIPKIWENSQKIKKLNDQSFKVSKNNFRNLKFTLIEKSK